MARGKTVLVVDDDILVRAVVARTLTQAGYRVREAASAATALVLLGSAPSKPDLILSDIHMPGMNGIDLATEVHRSWAELSVVLMSAQHPAHLPRGLTVGFLTKPFGPEALLRVVDLAMKQLAIETRSA